MAKSRVSSHNHESRAPAYLHYYLPNFLKYIKIISWIFPKLAIVVSIGAVPLAKDIMKTTLVLE